LYHGTVFSGFGTEFRDFLFRGTTGIPSEITICSVYSVFRGIIFLSEIPNPNTSSKVWQQKDKRDSAENSAENKYQKEKCAETKSLFYTQFRYGK
jgi:hypothetical protein